MKRAMDAGQIMASGEYAEVLDRLGRFEKILESGKAESILEGAQGLEKYFDTLKGKNPALYSATDGVRKKIAERMIAKFSQFLVAMD